MAPGITRASDRVAIWHEAAEDKIPDSTWDDFSTKPQTSAPPKGAPTPPAGQGVVVPNSNKFKTPANGLKKLVDNLGDYTGNAHSHPEVKSWLEAHPDFAKTYFKPQYQDALKAHMGEDSYNKAVYHMPIEHMQALTTQQQQAAPKSNKFKTPANGLKKLLENKDTQTGHVKAWMDAHPQFAKTYMGPGYADALKGHLGEKNYAELQKHLQAPTPPSEQTQTLEDANAQGVKPKSVADSAAEAFGPTFTPQTQEQALAPSGKQPYPSDAELDAAGITPEQGNVGQEVKPKPSVGEQLKALKPDLNAESLDAKLKAKTPEQIKELFDNTIGSYPDIAEGLQKIYDENYGKPQAKLPKVKLHIQPDVHLPAPPSGVGPQHPALAQGIKKVFPNADVEGKTDVELKGMLDSWLKYLPDHEGYAKHVPQLQKLQDQFFGGKAQGPSAPSPEPPPGPSESFQVNPEEMLDENGAPIEATPSVDLGALSKDMNSMGLGSVPEGFDAEKVKNYLQNWAGAATGASLKKKLQTVLDKHFGDADEISKIKAETPSLGEQYISLDTMHNMFPNSTSAVGAVIHTPGFKDWYGKYQEEGGKPGSVSQMTKKYLITQAAPGLEPADQGYGDEAYTDTKGEQPAFEQWHTPNFLKWMASEYGLQPGQVNDIAKGSAPGGKYENAGSLKSYFDEFQKGDYPKPAFEDDFKKVFPNADEITTNALMGKSPEEQKKYLQDLVPQYSEGGQWHDEEQLGQLKDLLNKHFGGDEDIIGGGDPWGSDAKGMTPQILTEPKPTGSLGTALEGVDTPVGWGTFMSGAWDGWSPEKQLDKLNEYIQKAHDGGEDETATKLEGVKQQYFPDDAAEPLGEWEQELLAPPPSEQADDWVQPTKADLQAIGIKDSFQEIANQTPEKFKKNLDYVKAHPDDFNPDDGGWGQIAQWVQDQGKVQEGGPPVQPFSWKPSPEQIAQLKQDMIDSGSSSKNDKFDWLTGMNADSWKSNLDIVGKDPGQYPPDSPWGKLYQQMVQKQQGGSQPTLKYDPNGLLQEYADIYGASDPKATSLGLSGTAWDYEQAKTFLKAKVDKWQQSPSGVSKGKGKKIKDLYDKYFGGAAPQPVDTPPSYDYDQFVKEYKQDFPDVGWVDLTKYKDPEVLKKKLQGLIDMPSFGAAPHAIFQKHYDKWFGSGATTAPAAPIEPWDWKKFAPEFKSLFAGSSWATDDLHTYADAQSKLKGMVEQAQSTYPDTEKTNQATALYKKYFGDDLSSTDAAYAKGQAGAEADLQGLLGGTYPSPQWIENHYGVIWSPEKIKESFDNNPTGGWTKAWKNDTFGDKDQYGGQSAAPPIPEEPEEDEGVSAPFKNTPAKDEDVAAWVGTKPETPGQWKDFAKWWGATQLSSEQESAIYHAWFPDKTVAPEKATAWFQKVFEYHSKPGTGDLESTDVPSWAHNSWAFGDKADKEWPVFQVWASKHPGIPQGSSIKQKVGIWKNLSAGDKKAIAADYLPETPVDTNAAVAALQKAYPDSDWTTWATMGQGTLAANVETLAKAGYDGAIPVYNQYFGGNVPMPKKTKKGEEAPKTAPALQIVPESKLPPWVKEKWGTGAKYAKDYTELKHWADSVGQGELAEKGPSTYGTADPHYKLRQKWQQTPIYLKAQIAQMKTFPWKDEAGFAAWVEAQPTLKTELAPIIGEDKLGGVWSYGGPTNYWSNKRLALGQWIDQEADPQKKQAMLGLYHKYFGAGKETLAQGLKSVYPDQDWDKTLKSSVPEAVQSQIKKAMKAEKDPEKFVHLVDLWNKYFVKPGTTNAANSGIGVVTKTLNKYNQGDTLSASDLKALHYWKTHDAKSGVLPDYWSIPDDYKSSYAQSKAEGTDTGDYPAYHGWTPPGNAVSGSFTADPAMLASTAPSYTAPEQVKGKQYQVLLDKMDKNKALYGKEDREVAASEQFSSWFASNSTPYKEQFQHNPGVAIDDYKAFMAGNAVDPQVTEGEGDKKVFDVSPFANVLPKGKKGPGGKALPISQTFNPQRDDVIKFPRYQDEQETLPLPAGQQWAPHYAPMPIYRLIKFPIDQQPEIPASMQGMDPKRKALFLEQQRERLRRIDEILHGSPKVRNTDNDYKHLLAWGKSHSVPEKELKEVADQLFSSQPALSSDERWKHFEDFAKTHSISAKEMYQLANQLGVGNPGQGLDPGGSYDHPELGQLLLDYIENGGNSGSDGMGIHWTRDIDKLYNGISAAGIGASEMKGQEGYTPILLSGYWGGQGEGGGEGGAYSAMDNREREHNLRPGAPVQLRRVQIRDPKGDFHDLMDYGPVSMWHPGRDETASGKKVFDKPSLAQHLQQALGSKFSAEDWDWMTPGRQADIAFNKLVGKYPEKTEEIRKIYKRFFVGRPDLPTKPHTRRASLAYFLPPPPALKLADLEETIEILAASPWTTDNDEEVDWKSIDPDWDRKDDDPDEGGEGYEEYAEPHGYKTPMFDDYTRPELPDHDHHYFSPHEVNPRSTSEARPNVEFDPEKLEQDPLPGFPGSGNAPLPLYRGMMLDLSSPELAHVRRALLGDEQPASRGAFGAEEAEYGPPPDDAMFRQSPGQAHPLGYDNPELGQHILNHINQPKAGYYSQSPATYGLGAHWTTSPQKADTFAGLSGGNPLHLPVRVRAEWKGAGEDPYRTNTQGRWPDEREITMLPGADMNISSVQIRHPKTHKWHEVLDKPAQHQAAAPVVERKRAGILTISERYL